MELKRDKGKKEGAMLQIWLMLLVMGIVLTSGFLLIPKTEEERQEMISFLGTTNTTTPCPLRLFLAVELLDPVISLLFNLDSLIFTLIEIV